MISEFYQYLSLSDKSRKRTKQDILEKEKRQGRLERDPQIWEGMESVTAESEQGTISYSAEMPQERERPHRK